MKNQKDPATVIIYISYLVILLLMCVSWVVWRDPSGIAIAWGGFLATSLADLAVWLYRNGGLKKCDKGILAIRFLVCAGALAGLIRFLGYGEIIF